MLSPVAAETHDGAQVPSSPSGRLLRPSNSASLSAEQQSLALIVARNTALSSNGGGHHHHGMDKDVVKAMSSATGEQDEEVNRNLAEMLMGRHLQV